MIYQIVLKRIVFLAVLFFGIVACYSSKNDSVISIRSFKKVTIAKNIYKEHDSDYVFNEQEIRTYRFTFSDSDWETLQNHGIDKKYRMATLEVGGEIWEEVAVRLKGAYSLESCFSGAGRKWDEHCKKLSLKLDFSRYDARQRFYKLKQLNLHAMGSDLSKMRERLGYYLFTEMGIPAPRSVPVEVYINGEYMGIYQAVENIDGRFTAHRFPDYGNGNLFKEIWPGYRYDEQRAFEALKTNNDAMDTSDLSDFRNFSNSISSATDTNFETTVLPYVDTENLLKYLVVDRAIHNWDGFLAFYWGGNHNYYWYNSGGGKFILIPWDLDKTFWKYDRYFGPNPAEKITPIPDWNVKPIHCGLRTIVETIGPPFEGPLTLRFKAPGCDPLINILASQYWDDFRAYGYAFLEQIFTLENLNRKLDEWGMQIDSIMKREPSITYREWSDEMEELHRILPKLRADLISHLEDQYRME